MRAYSIRCRAQKVLTLRLNLEVLKCSATAVAGETVTEKALSPIPQLLRGTTKLPFTDARRTENLVGNGR